MLSAGAITLLYVGAVPFVAAALTAGDQAMRKKAEERREKEQQKQKQIADSSQRDEPEKVETLEEN